MEVVNTEYKDVYYGNTPPFDLDQYKRVYYPKSNWGQITEKYGRKYILKNKRDRLFFTQLFMTIECSQSVHSIVCAAGDTK